MKSCDLLIQFYFSIRSPNLTTRAPKTGCRYEKDATIVNHFGDDNNWIYESIESGVSEERLKKVSRDITRIDVKLKVLEAKLASIKGLESTTADPVPGDSKTEQKEDDSPKPSAATSQDDEMVELNSKTYRRRTRNFSNGRNDDSRGSCEIEMRFRWS